MVEKLTFDSEFKVTDEIQKRFDEDGFIIVKNLLDEEEVAQIWKTLEHPEGIMKHAYETKEPDGKSILRIVFAHPGNDVSGIVSRSEKIVNACEKLLGGGEIFLYHGKFILKNAREGGSHVWHQDYGYWYKHHLFPDMITVWMALDKATRHNSCLQVLKGSHKCGRIDHGPGGSLQAEADAERIEELKKVCPLIYCEMEPGDVLFQHCNLLHKSSPNDSDMRRWAYVACYNKKSNSAFMKHYHAQYKPLVKVPDSEIKACRNYTDFIGKEFVNPISNQEQRNQLLHTVAGEKSQ